MKLFSNFGRVEVLIAIVISIATGLFIMYKVNVLGYTMSTIRPEDGYFVRLTMDVTGNGDDCNVRVTLPLSSEHQAIKYERESSGGAFKYTISPNRIGRWKANDFTGTQTITHSFFAQTEAVSYTVPQGEPIPDTYTEFLDKYLISTDRIQANDPLIIAKAFELAPEGADIHTAGGVKKRYCNARLKVYG